MRRLYHAGAGAASQEGRSSCLPRTSRRFHKIISIRDDFLRRLGRQEAAGTYCGAHFLIADLGLAIGRRHVGRRVSRFGGVMTYSVKETFLTVQGEGGQAGRPAVFLRFAGCNLWSGLERDRASAVCSFCDTDFVGVNGDGGGKFASPEALSDHVASLWRGREGDPKLVVCTGGEPLLQLDAPLIAALKAQEFDIAVETNGTVAAPDGIDWICVSPKADAPLVQTSGQELKLVFPQAKAMPERFEGLDFERFWLQPMDGPDQVANTAAAIEYCLEHALWRLSVQTHKYIGVR